METKVGLKDAKNRATLAGDMNWYNVRKSQFEVLPSRANSIVFLGDSLTNAAEWQELLQNSRIVNRGIGGEMTQGVIERLSLISASKPSMIFLMIGVNDILDGGNVEHIFGRYVRIIEQITNDSPDTRLILESVLPVQRRDKPSVNGTIRHLNEKVKGYAKQHNLVYIDINSHLLDSKGELDSAYSVDGVHINGSGYKIWADQVRNFLPPAH